MKPRPRYQPGDKIGGRYQVYQALMGGMGEVYLCLDLETNRPFALKTFQQRYLTNPKLRAAFENEVATWVALEKHPNIVRCFYMDIIDNQPFMFLEWIASEESRGTDLRSWLRRGPLDLRLALDFAIDICRGLIHAQQKQPGIVHRDLKPDNILVAQDRLAKITDFGLAKIVQAAELEITDAESETDGRQSLLGQGGIVGTPPYMAPEQWRGEALDARADIYAVGCILYELLTGSWPFQAATLDSLRHQHLEADIPKLTDSQTCSGALNTLLAGCLAKQREKRLATADDLLQRLALIYQQQFTEQPKAIPTSSEFTAMDYHNRGSTYSILQRYDEALADYSRAIQLDPNAAIVYINRGLTYHNLQRYNQALVDCDQAIELDPTFAGAYVNRGAIYADLQRYDAALADFDRAIKLDPTYAKAYANRGFTCYKLQRYDDALADYDQAIQLDPNDAKPYGNRGLIYILFRRYEEALAEFSQAIQLDPTLVQGYYNRGTMYENLRRYDEALGDYSRAIQLDPTFVRAYINRGTIHYNLQRYDEALADLNQAIQLDLSSTTAYVMRGVIYHNLRRYDEALTNFNQAIQLDPTLAGTYSNRGLTYHYLQRYGKALADYDRAIQLDPSFALAYSNRGLTYENLQRYDEALADYIRAVQLAPTLAQAYVGIGTVLGNLGRLREALPYLERAAQLGDPLGAQYAAQARRELERSGLFGRFFKKRR